jgi:hypothetical protein
LKLNVKKLRHEKNTIIVSTKESLENIEKIQWSDEVLEGKVKIEVNISNDK